MESQTISNGTIFGIIFFSLIVGIFYIACTWRIFTKAGQPGWAAIVPIYNMVVMLRIVGRPWWWLVLGLIPIVNLVWIVFSILLTLDLAKSFGKGTGFALGLIFLSFIFIPILAFGDARYVGPAGMSGQSIPAIV